MDLYNSTRIFISSTAQPELQDLRYKLKEELKTAGHQPLLFEQDFGLWTDNSLEDCLRKVEESEVYILFLSDRAGSFTNYDPNMTATYAEFDTALANSKVIIPFVEKHIFDFFSEHIKEDIDWKIREFKEQKDIDPRHTFEIVKSYLKDLEKHNPTKHEKIKSLRVDDYIWAFIYDVRLMTNWTYTESLANTERMSNFVKEALSQVLRELSPYYVLRKTIDESTKIAARFLDFKMSLPNFTQCLSSGRLDCKLLLDNLSKYLIGGDIYSNPLSRNPRTIATVGNCHAISLYKRNGDNLELVDFSGNITPEKSYTLNDPDAFVSSTYQRNNDDVENIFYNKDKQQIYFTKKIGDLIISCHFLLSEDWSDQRVRGYEDQIHSVIMKKRDQFDFVVDLLGGMLND